MQSNKVRSELHTLYVIKPSMPKNMTVPLLVHHSPKVAPRTASSGNQNVLSKCFLMQIIQFDLQFVYFAHTLKVQIKHSTLTSWQRSAAIQMRLFQFSKSSKSCGNITCQLQKIKLQPALSLTAFLPDQRLNVSHHQFNSLAKLIALNVPQGSIYWVLGCPTLNDDSAGSQIHIALLCQQIYHLYSDHTMQKPLFQYGISAEISFYENRSILISYFIGVVLLKAIISYSIQPQRHYLSVKIEVLLHPLIFGLSCCRVFGDNFKQRFILQFAQTQMEDTQCIGCRTLFQEAEIITIDRLSSEYLLYPIPIRDNKEKWNILRAVISFLNAKGGTIYIGIDSEQGQVKGVFLERKERDSFKLTFKQLIERIYPKVDLNIRQEVEVQYVPIFRGNSFEGKFVVKIVVQQGDPTQFYCISERIKLQEEKQDAKADEFQVFYAFERNNKGEVVEFRGTGLMDYIFEKAKTGKKVVSFHQGCNPQPPYLDIQIRTIHISSISEVEFELLKQSYEGEFDKMEIDYSIKYLKDSSRAEIYIEDAEDFEDVKSYLIENVQYLNSMFRNSTKPVNFVIKGEVRHYFEIHNQGDQPKKKQKHQASAKKDEKESHKFPYQERKALAKVEQAEPEPLKTAPKIAPRLQEIKPKSPVQSENVIIFTHIAPQSIDSLERYLRNSIYRAYDKKIVRYFNSLELQLASEKQLQNYLSELVHKESQLAAYGFKREIRYGICDNKLKICNADWKKSNELKAFLKEQMAEVVIDFKNEKNALVCEMASRQATCVWLDLLLEDRQFKKKFAISGRHNDVPKMKIYIQVARITKQ